MNKKYISLVVGLVLVAGAPLFAGAQTVTITSSSTLSALQAQMQSLLAQIASLRQQIIQVGGASTTMHENASGSDDGIHMSPPMMASGTPMMTGSSTNPGLHLGLCLQVSRNLSMGSQGDDVANLQRTLAQDPTIYTGTSTGYFGPATAKALLKFQDKYGIASTTASSTPYFGPMSRKFFENQCGDRMMNASGTMMASGTPPFHPEDMMNGSGTPPRPMMGYGDERNASGTPKMMPSPYGQHDLGTHLPLPPMMASGTASGSAGMVLPPQ
jgi:hypothetical protein